MAIPRVEKFKPPIEIQMKLSVVPDRVVLPLKSRLKRCRKVRPGGTTLHTCCKLPMKDSKSFWEQYCLVDCKVNRALIRSNLLHGRQACNNQSQHILHKMPIGMCRHLSTKFVYSDGWNFVTVEQGLMHRKTHYQSTEIAHWKRNIKQCFSKWAKDLAALDTTTGENNKVLCTLFTQEAVTVDVATKGSTSGVFIARWSERLQALNLLTGLKGTIDVRVDHHHNACKHDSIGIHQMVSDTYPGSKSGNGECTPMNAY